MYKIIELFTTLLNERLATDTITTEDSVRYTFFHALLLGNYCHHTEITLELPHPNLDGEIDTFIAASNDRQSVALEFKYDREIPSGQSLNSTNRAGVVFDDLFRLAHIPQAIAQVKYFIYVTDSIMASYFQNERNGYKGFFDVRIGEVFEVNKDFLGSRPKSFRDKISCETVPCRICGVFARQLAKEHSIRGYEVKT